MPFDKNRIKITEENSNRIAAADAFTSNSKEVSTDTSNSIWVDLNDSLEYRKGNGSNAITASQKIARDLGASSRAIQKAQPSAPSRDAELQAVRESASIPWYDIGALEAPATVASAQQPHPVEMLAMMGGPMAGEESDLASMELPVDPWEIAARSTLNRGLAKTIEEARQLVAEAI